MAKTTIEWTDDTWNPVTGCTRVSPGCDHCYAVTMTRRLEAMGQEKYSGLVNPGKKHFNGVVKLHDDKLARPLRWRKPRRVFVNSMSDLFHEAVPFAFIDRVFAVMALSQDHTFQILTKRPQRMAEYFAGAEPCDSDLDRSPRDRAMAVVDAIDEVGTEYPCRGHVIDALEDGEMWPLPNVWLGTSVESQATADERVPELLRCPAAVRFLSMEPLLGPVCFRWASWISLSSERSTGHLDGLRGIDWVIVGGESGPGARPMHPDWARDLRDQCAAAGVPFLFKQWGAWVPYDDDPQPPFLNGQDGRWIDGHQLPYMLTDHIGEPHRGWLMMAYGDDYDEPYQLYRHTGKKAAGRQLDGVVHDGFPDTRLLSAHSLQND